jgi:transketolase
MGRASVPSLYRDAIPIIYARGKRFSDRKSNVLREGNDVSLIAVGDTVAIALEAARGLSSAQGVGGPRFGLSTRSSPWKGRSQALHSHKPVRSIITVEDHYIYNGLGSAVAVIRCRAGKRAAAKNRAFRTNLVCPPI